MIAIFKRNLKIKIAVLLIITAVIVAFLFYLAPRKYTDWTVYGGSYDNIKYSELKQIDTSNVSKLKIAWVYHSENNDSSRFGVMECNPIIINNILFGVSPRLKLFALDAASGKEKWHFDPSDISVNKTWPVNSVNMNRGVAYWSDGEDKRIIFTAGSIVFAVNAKTGRLISSFGTDGGIDLKKGLDRDEKSVSVTPTSPALVYRNLFVIGGAVNETTPGHIRAYDVRTGKQKWIFHTVPYPGESGFESWEDTTAYKRMGSTNAWSGFSLDEKRGILYAAIGSPTNDFYGGDRLGNGLYGNCMIALDIATGQIKWHFQTVHHDVWDMDPTSPPALITLKRQGKKVDAIVFTTKTGMVYILDRVTGKSLAPIAEKPVPTHNVVAGEKLSPTQPFPVWPKPFVRHAFTDKDLNHLFGDSSFQDIKKRLHSYRSEGIFTPPSEKGTIVLPGYDGGAEWGGPAVDPESNILYVNANEMAYIINLAKDTAVSIKSMNNLQAGNMLYQKNCMGCHGAERLGSGGYPTLIGTNKKYNLDQFNNLLATGRRMMPGFNQLSKTEKTAIATFVLEMKSEQKKPYTGKIIGGQNESKPSYNHLGHTKFLNKEGYPAISPPWGSLSAINLNTGKFEWQVPFGEFEELKKRGIPVTGRENFGGPVVTAGGILFIGASADGKLRAINKRTGKTIWEATLPAPGMSTPAIYELDGRQYIVIACGGSKSGGKSSDVYIAYTLP